MQLDLDGDAAGGSGQPLRHRSGSITSVLSDLQPSGMSRRGLAELGTAPQPAFQPAATSQVSINSDSDSDSDSDRTVMMGCSGIVGHSRRDCTVKEM